MTVIATKVPTQITFRGMGRSAAVEATVLDRVAWLEQFNAHIQRCRVTIAIPHRHRRDGRLVHVRVEVAVPGGRPIVVNHEPSLHGRVKDVEGDAHHKETATAGEHRYAHVSVRQAFDAARRQVEEFARTQRGEVKAHTRGD